MSPGFSVVKCSFWPEKQKLFQGPDPITVIYAETEILDYQMLRKFISADEDERSCKFRSINDRCTYVCCHAILRLMLARRLNVEPGMIIFERGIHNKPYLPGDPVFFNISHTRKAFAIAISDSYVGIDLEDINRMIDVKLIMKSSFSLSERSYITEDKTKEMERLILLWTRKEAFLKAIGQGIITDLGAVNVSKTNNLISRKIIPENQESVISGEHSIFTVKISDDYLSVATPKDANPNLTVIDENNYIQFVSGLLKSDYKAAGAGYC